jgi:hypothetical protein
MSIVRKIKRAVRGEVPVKAAALETLRRSSAAIASRRERASLQGRQDSPARLRPPFDSFSAAELANHFRERSNPAFMLGFYASDTVPMQQTRFPEQTKELLASAERVLAHRWPLLGLGEQDFGVEIDWHRDRLSGATWPRDYHTDIRLFREDGSDVRLLWELNRLPQVITLARAFAVRNDERFSEEFYSQIESWRSQNPFGYGVNWSCAMEVALRAMNLLAAFEIFRRSKAFDESKLTQLLALLDQHGTFIKQNLEFSYITTSNHYLSDVVGLVWLGVLLPELQEATAWRDFGLREMLREMDKQVLADGADFESSTGYHRFVVELLLYAFILCRANDIDIDRRYWNKFHEMLLYIAAYVRPDGRAPLIGDTDGGQVLPIRTHSADDHAYLLPIGAAVFNDSKLKTTSAAAPEELLWILGPDGVVAFDKIGANEETGSQSFPNAATYVMRHKDLYLLFNAGGAGINGRGSHGHNDVLSIEVSAFGRPFIVDPGSFVYTADLRERHRFRSTAYHSTIEIDAQDQNTTDLVAPFVIGNEAQPRVLLWETTDSSDRVSAEHKGYTRFPHPVTHRRTVTFDRANGWWLIEDQFTGEGEHEITTRFHFDSGLAVTLNDHTVEACDKSGVSLVIRPITTKHRPELENQFVSRNYGAKSSSITARWAMRSSMPCKFMWALVPVHPGGNKEDLLDRIDSMLAITRDSGF